MVKILSKAEQETVANAVENAERATTAEIMIVVTPASDMHADFVLLYALIASSAAGLGLDAAGILHGYKELAFMQLVVIAVIFFTPLLRHFCWRLVPKRVLHKRSVAKALQEYSQIHRKSPANLPMVFLFVSLGERYAHIIPNRPVYEKIDDEHWDAVIAEFAKEMKKRRLAKACMEAARQIGNVLAQFFPGDRTGHKLSEHVIVVNN